MKNWVAVIIIFLLILTLGIFIGKSCKDDTPVSQGYEQIEKDIAEINNSMKALQDSMSVLAELRIETKNYYNYEITKIDSIYAYGGSVAEFDSTIRHWTNYIYGFNDFFAEPFRLIPDSTDSSSSGKLLPSN
jgi:hypothetical protein